MRSIPENVAALLEELQADGAVRLCTRYKRPPLPSRLLRALHEEQPTLLAHGFLARYPLSPSDLLERLGSESKEVGVLTLLADNPRTPPNTLSLLARHPELEVRIAMASNPRLTQREIQSLVDENHPRVCAALASNPSLKPPQQAQLATHREEVVRLGLTRNPSLDPDIALALSSDPSLAVRCQLAAEAPAEPELLLFWADCDREEIQLALLERSGLPDDVMDSLHCSPHASVRAVASQLRPCGPQHLLHGARSPEERHRMEVCARQDLPPGIQHLLCQDESPRVRATLAANPAIHPDLACHLVSDAEPSVCLALLDNPSLPAPARAEMLRVGDSSTLSALVGCEGLDPDLATTLVNQHLSAPALLHLAWHRFPLTHLRADLARALARHKLPCLRALAARSVLLEPDWLDELSQDDSPYVRETARSNPNFSQAAASLLQVDASVTLPPAISRCLREIDQLLEPPTVFDGN